MSNNYNISFIEENDFINHVLETVEKYEKNKKGLNLEKFNSNIIDPIKLIFDSIVNKQTLDEAVKKEIQRQKDKSNNNAIGYFHQYMFKYIKLDKCTSNIKQIVVPKNGEKKCPVAEIGADIILTLEDDRKIYVEMKNKHNTMNKASSTETFTNMKNILNFDKTAECYLVEVIAQHSQNETWNFDGNIDDRIRRISIDKFYEIITGDSEAFKKICYQLPITLTDLMTTRKTKNVKDTVIKELSTIDKDMLLALFKLAFGEYNGFPK